METPRGNDETGNGYSMSHHVVILPIDSERQGDSNAGLASVYRESA
jgi:hypothetical protein